MFSRKSAMIVGLIILVAANIIALSIISKKPYPSYGMGQIAITCVAPFQRLIVRSTRTMKDIWRHYFSLVSVARENDELRRKLQRARQESNRCREIRLANRRLRKLLALSQVVDDRSLAAEVVGKDPTPWFKTILVDKGRRHGVIKGMPVVSPDGVVGVIIEVAPGFSKVMLLTDPNSAVDALVQGSRARGIIKGGPEGMCLFKYVLRKHDIREGEIVVTSGMDGVFPKGLRVGKVASVVKEPAGIFQHVTVAPAVDFERLEEVLILPIARRQGDSLK